IRLLPIALEQRRRAYAQFPLLAKREQPFRTELEDLEVRLRHRNSAEDLPLLQIPVIVLPAAIEGIVGMRFGHSPNRLPQDRARELAPPFAEDRIELLDERS